MASTISLLVTYLGSFKMATTVAMARLKGFNVANHLEKRQLLIAINCIAALSIFFFGYDQGTILLITWV